MSSIDRGSERLLDQFLFFTIDRDGQVARRRQSELLLQMQLTRRGIQQVRTTDNVGDSLLPIRGPVGEGAKRPRYLRIKTDSSEALPCRTALTPLADGAI